MPDEATVPCRGRSTPCITTIPWLGDRCLVVQNRGPPALFRRERPTRCLTFDLAAPEERLRVVARQYFIGDYYAGQYLIDTLDIATGATVASLPIQLLDVSPAAGRLRGVSIRYRGATRAAHLRGEQQWIVVAVDLVTGEETLLYDGPPTADGAQLACPPEPAFDSRERRLLLVKDNILGSECTNVFALDADTGAFTRLASTIH